MSKFGNVPQGTLAGAGAGGTATGANPYGIGVGALLGGAAGLFAEDPNTDLTQAQTTGLQLDNKQKRLQFSMLRKQEANRKGVSGHLNAMFAGAKAAGAKV